MSNFFDQFDEAPAQPEASGNFFDQFDQPEPEAPEPREEGGAMKDLAMSFGRGSNMLLDGVGTLYGLATGDYDNWAKNQAASGMEYYDRGKSQDLVDAEQRRARALEGAESQWGKLGTFLWETVSDPSLLANTLAEQIPMLAAPGGAGVAAGRGAAALGASAKLAGQAGTAAGVGAGGALNAADSADTARNALLELPPEVWAQNADYAAMVADDVDPDIAKAQIAQDLSRDSAAVSFLISLVSQKAVPGGAAFEKAAGRGTSGLRGGIGERIVRGVAGETGQEVIEEVGAQGSANYNIGRVDPNQEFTEGFGEAAGGAIVAAGPMGGISAALGRGKEDKTPVTDTDAEAAVKALQDEAAEADQAEAQVEAVARQQQRSTEADRAASQAAYEAEAAGGDNLDALNAATSAYNEIESQQRSQADAEREIAALRDTRVEDALNEARSFGDNTKVTRLENAQRMRRTADQFEAQGRPDQAANFRKRADAIVNDILGPGGGVQTVQSQGQLIPAEQIRPGVAQRATETIDSIAADVTTPRLPPSNTIYGREPTDVAMRRGEREARNALAMEGTFQPGQPPVPAAPERAFGSELPVGEEIVMTEPAADPPLPTAQVDEGVEQVSDADYPRMQEPAEPRPDVEAGYVAFDEPTLGIPRQQMPQIKAEDRGALANFLSARGISGTRETVPADSLKPTQTNYSPDKVARARNTSSRRAILVSRDGRIVDGHHQWLAAREAGEDVEVIRLDTTAEDAISQAIDFPSSTTAAEEEAFDEGSSVSEGESPYTVTRDQKTGKITVTGDTEAARANLPDGVRGRQTKEGLSFSGSAAARAYNALTGRTTGYSRAGEVTKHPLKDGKYVGAPDKFNTPGKIPTLRKWLKQLATEGGPGRMWYENSSKSVLEFVGGDRAEARKFVALLSIYSPQAKVDANTTFALRAWAQYKAGQPISVKTRSQDKKAEAAMKDVDAFWSGEKTGNFFNNLLIEIDPETRGHQGATIDLWMMRAGQYSNDAPNRSQYAFMEVETNRLAAELGWEPHQVQAAIWVALKARMENKGVKQRTEARSEKKGWIRFDKDGKGKKVRVILDAQKHRDNWVKEALQLEVAQEDTDVAKFDYSDGIRRHVGTIGTEGATADIIEALIDDAGRDVLAAQLGLLADGNDVVVAPNAGKEGLSKADPAQVESLNIYADTLRQLSGAASTHWWRPFYKSRKMDQNAVMVSLDRMVTDEELEATEAAISEYMEEAGIENWADSFAILRDRDGMVLINFGAVKNSELRKIAGRLPDMGADFEQFAADGQVFTDGQQKQVAGVGSERQQSLLAWARGYLEEQGVESVSEPQAEEYQAGSVDPYDGAETRAGTTEEQKNLGRSAVRDIVRLLDRYAKRAGRDNRPAGRGESVSLLGARVAKNFQAGRPNQLIGQKVESSGDLALLAQVYRDPRFETFRFALTRDGKIVGETAVTSRLPGMVRFGSLDKIADPLITAMRETGADGYYMLHNHPSSESIPSDPDKEITRDVARTVDGFLGHVVIDFNEYSTIDADGSDTRFENVDLGSEDFAANPEQPHDLLGQKVTSPNALAKMAKKVADPDRPVLIMTSGASGSVNLITSVPRPMLSMLREGEDRPAADKVKAMAALRRLARATGSNGRMFVVLPKGMSVGQTAKSLMDSVVTDVVSHDGTESAARDHLMRGASFMNINVVSAGGKTRSMPKLMSVEERLEGMPEYVEVDGQRVKFENFEKAQDAARKYMEKTGLEYSEPTEYAPLDTTRAAKIAREFDLMEHAPNDPVVKAAYDAMIKETLDQYQAILDTGLTIRFIKGADPYNNPRNAILDVIENDNLFVFPTVDGFGSSDLDVSDNPLLAETKFKTADGDPMLANDVFRVVHDYFGHIKNGVGFRARGEENAWQSHASMYSPLARRAMTTETRGQNSWVNFGPNAEANRTASGADTVYADQKIGLLPIWVSEEGRLSDRLRRGRQEYRAGLEGAVVEGRLQLSHFSRGKVERTEPARAGTGLDRKVGGRRFLPQATYFGITQADENGYRREAGLGTTESRFSIEPELIYPLDSNPLNLEGSYPELIQQMQEAGFSGFRRDHPGMGKVAVVWDSLISDEVSVNEEVAGYDVDPETRTYAQIERLIAEANIPGLQPSKRNPEGSLRAANWLQYLRNREVKQEEWRWTGLRDLLSEDRERRFTREELLDEARSRRVRVQDINTSAARENSAAGLSAAEPTGYMDPAEVFGMDWVRLFAGTSPDLMELVADEWRASYPEQDPRDRPNTLSYWDYSDNIRILGALNADRFVVISRDSARDDWQREIVRVAGFNEATVLARSIEDQLVDDNGLLPDDAQFEEYIDEGPYSDYHEIKLTLPENESEEFVYKSHFKDPNIVAFIRATMRDSGRRYHMEELQSDWHQRGRQYGYRTKTTEELDAQQSALTKQYLSDKSYPGTPPNRQGLWVAARHQAYKKILRANGIKERIPGAPRALRDWKDYDLAKEMSEEQLAEFERLASMAGQLSFDAKKAPDAPFKNDSWINLGVKRALTEAVNRGARHFSWSDAETVEDRWSEESAELYQNTYDKKVPALVRRLTGQQAKHVIMYEGGEEQGQWRIEIPENFRQRVEEEGLPLFRGTDASSGMTTDNVREIVGKMSADMSDQVNVVQSVDELGPGIRDAMKRQGLDAIAGYYDRRTRQVWLVADGLRNAQSVQRTVLHEVIGHRGIENVMGRQFDEFLAMVQSARGNDRVISDAYDHVDKIYSEASDFVKAAEVVARIAESDPRHNLVQRAIQWMRETLRRLGFNVMFTNDDIIEALRRAKTARAFQPSDTIGLFSAGDTDSNVTSLADARANVDMKKFRKSMMEKIREGASKRAAMAQSMDAAGAYAGFEVGDRFRTTTPSGVTNVFEVTGKTLGKPLANLDTPSDMIFDMDGKPLTPFLRVESADTQTMLQVSGLLGREDVVKLTGPRGVFATETRSPEMQEQVRRLADGEITNEEYAEQVGKIMPIEPFTEVPQPATYDEMVNALHSNKRDRATGDPTTIPDGVEVGNRLDIPAYTDHGVWVASIHDGKTTSGKPIAYTPTAVITDVAFTTNPKAALGVARGKPKATFARMMGKWKGQSPEQAKRRAQLAMKSGDWVQVGMNPERHSFFYDKSTGRPVVSADEVIQVGALVMAKGVEYGSPTDEQFRVGNSEVFFSADDSTNFAVPDETLTDVVIRRLQDKFQPLKKLQQAISDAGGRVDESNDAYLAEELFHGKTENDLRLIRDEYIEPLANRMAELGITHDELDQYLYAMHAPERNKHIASINERRPDGGSGMTDLEAGRILARAEKDGKTAQLKELSQYVYKMLEKQREMIVKGGLEDDGTIEAWKSKYRHYVPLKGFAEDTKDQGRPRTGRGFQISGPESKRAAGRSSQAASPLAYAISDLTEKVIRKRKNEVALTLLKLIEDNPNPDLWEVFTKENPDKEEKVNSRTGKVEITTIKMQGHPDYFQAKRNGEPVYMKIKDKRLMNAMQNLGPESINGVLRAFAGFNRYLSAVNTSYSPEFMVSNFARDVQTAILNLSTEQSLGDKGKVEGEKIVAATIRDIPKAWLGISQRLFNPKAEPEGEWQQWFEEFRAAGAQTGYFDMKDIDGQRKEIDRIVRKAQGGLEGMSRKMWDGTKEAVENVNRAVENAVRLSAYANARRAGISEKKAASLAKNMTVNFNRRGELGSYMNAMYMFFNASVQGTANFVRTMGTLKGDGKLRYRNLTRGQKIGAALVAGSFALSMANRLLGGEDDDGEKWIDKIPDYERERNLIIMKSVLGGEQDGSYWKIPLPYGYNIFHVLGDALEGSIYGSRSPMDHATRTVMAMIGSFSPVSVQGSEDLATALLKTSMPTIAKPIVDLAVNENFMGSTIYTENFGSGPPKPESSLGRENTNPFWVGISKLMNEASGGSDYRSGSVDVNPDKLEYLFEYALGSAGAFVNRTSTAVADAASGVPLEAPNVPFARRLQGQVRQYGDRDTFYERRDDIAQTFEEMKSIRDPAERAAFNRKFGDVVKLRGLSGATEKALKLQRKIKDRIYEDESLSRSERKARLRAVQEREEEIVDRFNRAWNESVR
jgi:hypothetical protein